MLLGMGPNIVNILPNLVRIQPKLYKIPFGGRCAAPKECFGEFWVGF